ncbi:hypothetical protein ABE426_19340 [Sphingobacterium faecium]|uniref:hypothetical protein n=1 Tax=Sphingobacterium faecium TaxID=34087 RepID=UPI003209A80C
MNTNLRTMWKLQDCAEFDFYQEIRKIVSEMPLTEEVYKTFNNTRYFGEWFEEIIIIKQVNCQEELPAVHIDQAITDLIIKLKEMIKIFLLSKSLDLIYYFKRIRYELL